MRSTKTPQNSFPCTLLHSLFINIVEETAKIIWSCSWTKIVCVFHYYVQVHSCRIVSLSSPLPLASLWASSWCWHNCGRLLVLSHFGTCMCSNVETNLSWTCLVSGPLNFEHPSVLLFCLKLLGCGRLWLLTRRLWRFVALWRRRPFSMRLWSFDSIPVTHAIPLPLPLLWILQTSCDSCIKTNLVKSSLDGTGRFLYSGGGGGGTRPRTPDRIRFSIARPY